MKYIKPLDSLRAIAVLLVIVWHWLYQGEYIVPYGPAGVVIFFVLSGFLITKILLDGRNKTESTGSSKKSFLKNFFIRRSLRIFPIYYLLIISFFIYSFARHQNLQGSAYYFTYTSNFYFVKTHQWNEFLAHTWSLAVEEQFYLVWPFIILFTNRKYLLFFIIGFIATGVISQAIAGEEGFGKYLTFACFDSLGWGALLAWVATFKPAILEKLYKVAGLVSAALTIMLFVEIYILKSFIIPFRMQGSVIAFFIVTYIVYVSYNQKKIPFFLNIILNNNLLASIGKISYGIYLYHMLIPYATFPIFNSFVYGHLPAFFKIHYKTFLLTVNLFVLFLVSALSWKFIEKPLLYFKKYFVMKDRTQELQPETKRAGVL